MKGVEKEIAVRVAKTSNLNFIDAVTMDEQHFNYDYSLVIV